MLFGGLHCSVRTQGFGLVVRFDDGSGLMDCIYWEDNQFRDALPALADEESSENSLSVGMMVKVMGRLEGTSETGVTKREIRVSWCQPIHTGSHRRVAPFSLDTESRHVLKVAEHKHSSLQEVLEALGPHLQQQIVERQDFPSADDTVSAWRLFGVHCKCPATPIKTTLLYCSCIATPESTDANFCFRMKLLELLLSLADRDSLFYFQYQQLLKHQHHFDGIVSHSNFNHLLQRTIGALRSDGIIALVDEESDTYLLITYHTVLKPYVELLSSQSWEDSVVRSALQKNSPEFLRNVPKGKMQLVRRMLQEETKERQKQLER
ncbi:hypothetical protein FisN_37Hh007 [Fistulifera solaris]|uniref:OB domain-containing protein n=1 Tax=Fistulifera solaris TaxID=1519565 RepID=A0A1Z5KJH8_FISSO|nr:hypothetical protein FisN_37Hh007 [Fistulifera solaris]|eukprot:GAX26443.1 hypothetical protein FisN_37Hh007 [Fistulifera solaris]